MVTFLVSATLAEGKVSAAGTMEEFYSHAIDGGRITPPGFEKFKDRNISWLISGRIRLMLTLVYYKDG